MKRRDMDSTPARQGYRQLRDDVLAILEEGKERARQAVERERVRTYWAVGDVLHTHLLGHQDRAEYGERIIGQLAEDLSIGERRLYEMLEVRRTFPKLRPAAELGWTHYVAVLGLPTKREREYYLAQAGEGGWSRRELQAAIRAEAFSEAQRRGTDGQAQGQGSAGAGGKRLLPKRGELYTYRVAEPDESADEGLVLDLGFEVQHDPEATAEPGIEPRNIVAVTRTEERPDRYAVKVSGGKRAKLYTYRASVLRVVDGDTLWVRIDLGFRIKIRQKLRLRGIDAPEMDTDEGKRARDYVKAVLSGVPWVVVTTTRPDKYDRYLSDVFYPKSGKASRAENAKNAKRTKNQTSRQGKTRPEDVAREGEYLNGEMVKKGMAVRV